MDISWPDFQQALRDTQIWCQHHLNVLDLPGSLRNPRWKPPEYEERWGYTEFHPEDLMDIISRRREGVGLMEPVHATGRILCVLEDMDLYMGDGIHSSGGVIDGLYLPPWDTWFAILPDQAEHRVLLAWIPEVLVPHVERAAQMSVLGSFRWLDASPETDPENDWFPVQGVLRHAERLLMQG